MTYNALPGTITPGKLICSMIPHSTISTITYRSLGEAVRPAAEPDFFEKHDTVSLNSQNIRHSLTSDNAEILSESMGTCVVSALSHFFSKTNPADIQTSSDLSQTIRKHTCGVYGLKVYLFALLEIDAAPSIILRAIPNLLRTLLSLIQLLHLSLKHILGRCLYQHLWRMVSPFALTY